MAIVNAFILFKELTKEKLSMKDFRRRIVDGLLAPNQLQPQKINKSSCRISKHKPHISPEVRFQSSNDSIAQKKNFRIEWLKQYRWLVYSRHLKGGLCKHCVVFRPVVKRGLLGALIVSEFTKYKDFHFHAKKHMQSEWHRDSVSQSTEFLKIMANKKKSVIDQLNIAQHSQIEQNRKKATIRGKLSCSGNFHDLLKFRVSFSLLADETFDIAGIEQLSIGVRYVDSSKTIREEFIGFSALQTLDEVGIATSILTSVEKYGLDMNKLVGLGFDGCSEMAGKENGVQKIICDKYSKAKFFHCASHRLNLVVNDLNAVTEIQNTVGVIKEVIIFFRESVLRRKLVTNIPLLCDTRWSAK
ncbi:uncharacterized protein LOC132948668 [Metopolophium dirhodum]|uniref:uncharacterized protein LOC132948668 n=1 Tax=Metopolophium dirhodum TaxID=44670 RepID=UPI00298F6613|nr:uncharacterized protein LOC132948668 [Metopolophium dirhodum]